MATKTKAPAPAATGLGDFAAPVQPATKRPNQEIIQVDTTTAKHVDALVKAKAELDDAKERVDANGAKLKQYGRNLLVNAIKAGQTVASVILASAKHGAMYIPTDRFAKIKEEALDQVRSLLGDKYVKTTTVYSFNPELVAKYGKEITAALQSLDIPADDKRKLLNATLEHEYTFGINEVGAVAKERNLEVSAVLELVGVVEQIKIAKTK